MRKAKTITIVSCILLCIGLLSTLLFEDEIASRIAEVMTLITTVVGAIALYLQFKRDKEINKASFLLEFWKSFSESPSLQSVMQKCDKQLNNQPVEWTEEDYDSIVLYGQWLEALSSVINKDILTFEFINNMYNYCFFVFVNKYIQEKELLPNKPYYQGIITAYRAWLKYLRKHKLHIMLEENSLDLAWDRDQLNGVK